MDSQDQAIVDALEAGKTDEEIKAEFGVSDARIEALRSIGAEGGDATEGTADEGGNGEDSGAEGEEGAGSNADGDEASQGDGEAPPA